LPAVLLKAFIIQVAVKVTIASFVQHKYILPLKAG
jgi:hypothetical protein